MWLRASVFFIFLLMSFSCDKNYTIKNQLKEAIETSNLEKIESIINNNPNLLKPDSTDL